MGLRFSKRGDLVSQVISPPLILVLVMGVFFLMAFYKIYNIADSNMFELQYAAVYCALMMKTMTAVPGNLVVDTPFSTKGFTFEFKRDRVTVYENIDDPLMDKAVGEYYLDKKFNFQTTTLKPTPINIADPDISDQEKENSYIYLRFAKIGNSIFVSDITQLKASLNSLPYQHVDTQAEISEKTIVLDPGQCNPEIFPSEICELQKGVSSDDFSEFGLYYNITEYGFTKVIVDKLLILMQTATQNTFKMNQDELEQKISQVNALKPELLISIHAGKDTDMDINMIKAYIRKDSPESKKLAALIVNNLLEDANSFTGVTVISVDTARLAADDPRKVIDGNFTGVVLELGNVNSDAVLRRQEDIIAKSIYDSIKEYYQKPLFEAVTPEETKEGKVKTSDQETDQGMKEVFEIGD